MVFNSFEFLWLFPILWGLYWAVQVFCLRDISYSRIGNYLLLIISYGLYLRWRPEYALILLWVTATSFIFARGLSLLRYQRRKPFFIIGICLILLPLLFFKYWTFLGSGIKSLISLVTGMESSSDLRGLNYALPIGLSFYTFQAIAYLSDVYHCRIDPEKNWWDYMLFIAFFPQILSGPISRAGDLLPQIKATRIPDRSQFTRGLRFLLWGMFMKVVLADRAGIYVNTVLNNYSQYTAPSLVLGTFLYAFQIYGDFAGYSYMAVGVGDLMGFKLINNFQRPYLSQSVSEFWRRWHISLSTWLRDYVYIPLGGSHCSRLRNYHNIIITFLVSGIWHGANWTFIVWGVFHGVFQVIEKALGIQKMNSSGPLKAIRILVTFCIISILWLFFRMPTISDACAVIKACFVGWGNGVSSMTKSMGVFIILALVVVAIKDLLEESHLQWVEKLWKMAPVRMTLYLIIVCLILTCGVFDSSQFIYVGF